MTNAAAFEMMVIQIPKVCLTTSMHDEKWERLQFTFQSRILGRGSRPAAGRNLFEQGFFSPGLPLARQSQSPPSRGRTPRCTGRAREEGLRGTGRLHWPVQHAVVPNCTLPVVPPARSASPARAHYQPDLSLHGAGQRPFRLATRHSSPPCPGLSRANPLQKPQLLRAPSHRVPSQGHSAVRLCGSGSRRHPQRVRRLAQDARQGQGNSGSAEHRCFRPQTSCQLGCTRWRQGRGSAPCRATAPQGHPTNSNLQREPVSACS